MTENVSQVEKATRIDNAPHINKAPHMAGLDIFRVMAVLVVLMFHTKIHHDCEFGFADEFVRMGAIFMTGFFMLSGFVLFTNYSGKNITELPNLK